jgi:hypothetical protein
LALFKSKLIDILKVDGMQGITAFSRKMRNERRLRPDTGVLEIKRSVYGIPDAGQAFSMFVQSLHIKKCGMVQSDIDPCINYKIMENDDPGSNKAVSFGDMSKLPTEVVPAQHNTRHKANVRQTVIIT